MKKNILNLYEGFFDDLDKLNQDDEFGGTNGQVYDEHDFILSPYKNPEFFKGLCNMCKDKEIPYNEKGFTQEDLDKITYISSYIWRFNSYFRYVTSLNELKYFHNLKKIIGMAYCQKLKSVIFPENLEIIQMDAFGNCYSLKELIFPENIQFIGIHAFSHCISLEKIIIPKNIIDINNWAFSTCSSLKKIVIPEKFKDNMKNIFDKVDLSKVDITYI